MSTLDYYGADNLFDDTPFFDHQFTSSELNQFSTDHLISVMANGKPCNLPLTDPDKEKAVATLATLDLKPSKNWAKVSRAWMTSFRQEMGSDLGTDEDIEDMDEYIETVNHVAEVCYRNIMTRKMIKMTPAETMHRAIQLFESRGLPDRSAFLKRLCQHYEALNIKDEDIQLLKKVSASTPEPQLNDLYGQFLVSLFKTLNLSSEVLQLVSNILGLPTCPSLVELVDRIYQMQPHGWEPSTRHLDIMSFLCANISTYLSQPQFIIKAIYQNSQPSEAVQNPALWLILPNV